MTVEGGLLSPHELCTDEKTMIVFLSTVDPKRCDYAACALRAAEHGFFLKIKDMLRGPIDLVAVAHAVAFRGTEHLSEKDWRDWLTAVCEEGTRDFHPVREWIKGLKDVDPITEDHRIFARTLAMVFDYRLYWTGLVMEFGTSCMFMLECIKHTGLADAVKNVAKKEKKRRKIYEHMRTIEKAEKTRKYLSYPDQRILSNWILKE